MQKLDKLQRTSRTIQGSTELSLYNDPLTKQGIAKGTALIMKAFPKLTKDQLDILRDRFIEHKFTDQRILDSIKNVIDTYPGWDKTPNIANFIQFNAVPYTYHEVLAKVQEGESMDKFELYDKENKLWRKK